MASPVGERAISDALEHGTAILKFISPNNVGITGSHECGFYLPIGAWRLFTPNAPTSGKNAKSKVKITWQDGRVTDSVVTWYGKAKHEYRLTCFGKDFPYLASDTVGDLLVLIPKNLAEFSAYVLDLEEDIEDIQVSLGVEIIDSWGVYERGRLLPPETHQECIERQFRQFSVSVTDFPSTTTFSEFTRKVIEDCIGQLTGMKADDRLLEWMDKEYILFRMVERQLCQSQIVRPFGSVDDFLKTAASIMNRRKSRAGRSLENHFDNLLRQEQIPFALRPRIDGTIEPDILIPGKSEYENPLFPQDKLCILGLKTTCKDRWRQVLNEGKRVPHKHILTLQRGISVNQLNEMHHANVTLVVPQKLHKEYPPGSAMQLMTIDEFIAHVKSKLG